MKGDQATVPVGWSALTAFCASGALAGTIRFLDWFIFHDRAWLAGLADAAQCVMASGCLGCLALAIRVFPPRAQIALTSIFSFLLGMLVLPDDVGSFASRQTFAPQPLAYWGAIGLISQTVVAAALVGALIRRRLRVFVGAGLCLVALVLNDFLLQGDYRGIHLLASVCGIVVAGVSFSGNWVAQSLWRKGALVLGLVVSASFAVFAAALPRLASTLSTETGAAFQPFVVAIPGRSFDDPAGEASSNVWLNRRDGVRPIRPTNANPLPAHPVVLMISVDALRADVVNDGKHDALLPNLARIRNEGLVFRDARAPGTLTKNSLSSLFLGTYFSQQYWSPMKNRSRSLAVFRDKTIRFTEILSNHHVATFNFRPISWVRNGVMLKGIQEDIKIKYPRKKSYYAPSPPVFEKLLPRVKKMAKQPSQGVFLFSHLADAHAPYDQGRKKKGPAFSRYLSEVQLVDQHLGKLLRLIEDGPLSERVLLIVTADHGEAFGEHGARTHGTNLYDEALRVPLIFWRPGITSQERNELVSVIDLGPTILDAFGFETPGHMMGQSLLPFLTGEVPELTRPILAETRLKRALVMPNRMKLIVDVRKNTRELYDLKTDPKELRNLAGNPELLREPLSFMNRFFEVHQRRYYEGKPYKVPYVR